MAPLWLDVETGFDRLSSPIFSKLSLSLILDSQPYSRRPNK